MQELKKKLSLAEELITDLRLREEDLKKRCARLEEVRCLDLLQQLTSNQDYEFARKDNNQMRLSMSVRKGDILSKELGGFGNFMNERDSLFRRDKTQGRSMEESIESK